ncbi:hypothetical protein [Peribacillus asahii]|uniref:hypothetical protein n=1 Tax=Peribacillus asahii TaxID=228899 RepID=UPI0037FDCAAA
MLFNQIGNRTIQQIVREWEIALSEHYPATSKLINTPLYILFKSAIEDEDFLKITIFCNDKMQMPPVEVFIAKYKTELIAMELTSEEKKGLGSMFGALYRFVLFGYHEQEKGRKQYRNNLVSSASYFIPLDEDNEGKHE